MNQTYKNVLLMNGPNLNLLGEREPHIYGSTSLNDIEEELTRIASDHFLNLQVFQSNHEGELIDRIHLAKKQQIDVILLNPGAFTHTSIALRDALLSVAIPFIEIHLSIPEAREPFRHQSYFSDIAIGVIKGFGAKSYLLALSSLIGPKLLLEEIDKKLPHKSS